MCITVNIKNRRQNYNNFKKMHKKLDENNIIYTFSHMNIILMMFLIICMNKLKLLNINCQISIH